MGLEYFFVFKEMVKMGVEYIFFLMFFGKKEIVMRLLIRFVSLVVVVYLCYSGVVIGEWKVFIVIILLCVLMFLIMFIFKICGGMLGF